MTIILIHVIFNLVGGNMVNNNWRAKVGKKRDYTDFDWKLYQHEEFVRFAEEVELLSRVYDWNFRGGMVGNYSVTLSQAKVINPNNVSISEYTKCIGETMDDALKYIHSFLIDNKYVREYGDRTCFMGGAYDRFPLAKKWALEEMEEMRMKDKISV